MQTGPNISILIGGEAGNGVQSMGVLTARSLVLAGYEVCVINDFQSRIRGGHVSTMVHASTAPAFWRGDSVNTVVALNRETVELHAWMMDDDALLILDAKGGPEDDPLPKGVPAWRVAAPFGEICRDRFGSPLYRNTMMLGAMFRHLLGTIDIPTKVISDIYGRKGERVVGMNREALEAGADIAAGTTRGPLLPPRERKGERLLLTGNDALALGAVAAGCRFISGYPITPATRILEFMAKALPDMGGVAVQAEDEIAAVNMAIGAAFTGARAMTSTSGPGVSLMMEGIGYAISTETPLVLVDVQRAGPSTGMPTRTEQGDLLFLVNASHSDGPRIVIAPMSIEDSFYLGAKAFDLAEEYQTVVVILSDFDLGEGYQAIPQPDLERVTIRRGRLVRDRAEQGFRRYAITPDGISPRSIPGCRGGAYVSVGNEHDEFSMVTDDPENRVRMMEKRMRKYESMTDLPENARYGDEGAPLGVISFGSTSSTIREAIDRVGRTKVRAMFLRTLHPLDHDQVHRFIDSCERTFIVELNASAQLARHISHCIGRRPKVTSVLRYDGRGFRPGDIVRALTSGPERERIVFSDRGVNAGA